MKTCSKENRLDFMQMLLSNLSVIAIRDVQNIAARLKKKKKFSTKDTAEKLQLEEEGWWECSASEAIMNWAATVSEFELVGYIKAVLEEFRESELQMVRSTLTFEARLSILLPEKAVSRPRPVPAEVGWWSAYPKEAIIAMDCEMVSAIIGQKNNGKPRCVQKAAKVSIASYEREIIYKRTIYHEPKSIYLTPIAKKLTGFSTQDFVTGTPVNVVQDEIRELFKGKLVVMIGCGSDFNALQMNKGNYDVFDLHEYFRKDSGPIGLRSLVMHYYYVDIQKGIHDPDVDSMYTMRLFTDVYMKEKLQNPTETNLRGSSRLFNEIPTVK
ncbi:unnamed protein product [Orchesella dallaii]|uniref:Exonuclease domain-containing protein n=1 Tax=Orchesella dallaii TaxID=48710 RepID=A0ABP1PSF2_9HEXA